jgi:hypothetical protein
MMSNSNRYEKIYPKSRSMWSQISKAREIETKGAMTRFYARFAMAQGFRGVVFDGYSPSSVRGYGALLRLQLAYSALDVFVKAANLVETQLKLPKKAIYEYRLIDSHLASQLKDCHQLVEYLMEMCSSMEVVRRMHLFIGDVPFIAENSTLIEKLNNCRRQLEAQGKEVELVDGDVLFIAASLRHGVAHGDMSLHSVGVDKSSVVKLVELLAQKVLELAEREFDHLVESVKLLPVKSVTALG